MPVDVGSAVGYLDLDINGFLKKLRQAQEESDKTTKKMSEKVSSNMKSIGSKLSSAGASMTRTVTLPLLGVGAAGLKVATDFEKSMSGVKAITKATEDDFKNLRDTAIDLGAKTAYSSTEVADAMTEMAKAGWDSQQIIDGMAGVLDAAAASGEELGTVSTIVADAITGFGMQAKDSTKVADLLTQAANAGTIGINDLGESFKYVAPVAASLGYDIEDTTTAIAAMSKAGIKGSQAGTALRTLFTNMANPTDAMAAAMDDLGVSLYDNEGKMYSMKEVLDQLRSGMGNLMVSNKDYANAIKKLDGQLANGEITQNQYNLSVEDLTRKTFGAEEAEKARAAAMLAGKEGMSGLLAITNMTQEEYDALSKSMEESSGVADETASVMQDNLQSQVEQLGGSLESLAIKLADLVIPFLKDFVSKLTELVNKFTSLTPETQSFILKMVGIVAAVGPVLSIFGKLSTVIGTLVGVFGKLPLIMTNAGKAFAAIKAAILGISAPVAAVVGIVLVLVGAFITLWNTNEEFRNNIIGIWNQIVDTFNSFTQGIVDRLNALGFDFENITEVIWAVWEGFCNLLAPVFEGVFQYIANTFQTITGVITGLLDVFIGLFTGNWQQFWQGIQAIFGSIWNGIVLFFQNIWNVFIGIVNVVLGWFGTSWNEMWTSVTDFFVNLWNGIQEWWMNLWNSIYQFFVDLWNGIVSFFMETIPNFFNELVNFFATLPERIGYIIGYILGSIVKFGIDAWNWVTKELPKIINGIVDWFAKLPGRIWEWLKQAISKIGQWGTNTFNSAKDSASKTVNSIVDWFAKLPGRIWEWLTSVVSKIGQWGVDMYNSAKEQVTKTVDAIVGWFKDLPKNLVSIGENMVKGIWEGIQSLGGWLWEQIRGLCGGLVGAAMDALGIHSPSTVMADKVGKFMPQGIVVGFEKEMPKATKDMQTSIDKNLNKLNADVEIEPVSKINDFGKDIQTVFVFISGLFDSVENRMKQSLFEMSKMLKKYISLSNEFGFSGSYTFNSQRPNSTLFIDYNKLAQVLSEVMKNSPIEMYPELVIEDGDVYLDSEIVGRKMDTKLKEFKNRRKRGG